MYQLTYDFLTAFFSGYSNTAFIEDASAVLSSLILGGIIAVVLKCIFAIVKRCIP